MYPLGVHQFSQIFFNNSKLGSAYHKDKEKPKSYSLITTSSVRMKRECPEIAPSFSAPIFRPGVFTVHQKSKGKQIWVAEVIEQLCPSMVQDPSATPGSKIGVERQVVIFTRHKLVEYVRNSAPDVMPLQKYIYAHLFEVCSLSAPERHITQVHIYDLGAFPFHRDRGSIF